MIGVFDAAPAQLAADFEAVLAREHDVEQDQVEGLPPGPPQGALSVRFDLHFVPLVLQVELKPEGDRGIVFHHQDAFHVIFSKRQQDGERAAPAGFALQSDLAAVGFDDVAGHGQPDARSLGCGPPASRRRGRIS